MLPDPDINSKMFFYSTMSARAVVPTEQRPQRKKAGHKSGIRSISEWFFYGKKK